MSKITVIGAGMVGSVIALDLANDHNVKVLDINKIALNEIHSKNSDVAIVEMDVTDIEKLEKAVGDSDLVVGAVPGHLGYKLLENLIELGKNVVDISFCPEDVLALHSKALEKELSIFVDAGVAPGLSNLFLGRYAEEMQIDSFKCMVGGLPLNRVLPWEYKAPFSPIDVMEEYTRPARFIRNGNLLIMEPLTEVEEVDINGISLEAFNSDGLRTLMHTHKDIPNMIEKTLRYPGHADKILSLKNAGMFKKEKYELGDLEVSPLEISSKVLIDSWKLEPGEPEFTLMHMAFEGIDNNTGDFRDETIVLYDENDLETGFSSMARTTGFTAAAVVNYFLNHSSGHSGVVPLETLGKSSEAFNYVLDYLRTRNVNLSF
jgi:lysine 6-dehydrogenase